MAIPLKEYAAYTPYFNSKGLPQSLRSFAKTVKLISLPPSGEVVQRADRGFYVILSASEISHDLSERYMPYGNPPSREIASSLCFSRKDK